jgi:hypothetical protein
VTVRWPPAPAWDGGAPWDEVWFLELHLDDHTSLWLRYTLLAKPDGVRRGVWAIWSHRGETVADTAWSLDAARAPEAPPALHVSAGGALTPHRATGQLGRFSWDLALDPGGVARPPGHAHVPPLLTRLGLGRTYESAAADLRAEGWVTVDGVTHPVRARGVLGHIFGRRNRTQSWAWAHAHGFRDAPSTVLEGISARLGHPSAPPLTSLRLAWPGGALAFSSLRDLIRTTSRFDGTSGQRWTFSARSAHGSLEGEARLGPTVALLQYEDESGRPIWCRNAADSAIAVDVRLRGGPPRHLQSVHAAFELATRARPEGEVVAP